LVALPILAIILAAVGLPLWLCLLTIVIAPIAIVLSFELGAWRALDAQLNRAVNAGRANTGTEAER
jgi:uncharacterized membrane protein